VIITQGLFDFPKKRAILWSKETSSKIYWGTTVTSTRISLGLKRRAVEGVVPGRMEANITYF